MKKYILIFLGIIFTASFLNAASDSLKATIIGSGSPIYNPNRVGPSVLITQGTTSILVDMGNGTQANLNKLKFNVRNLSALFFTHHHLDHNEEFLPIFIRSILGRKNFTIAGPPNTKKMVSSSFELYKEDISYRLSKSRRNLQDRQNAYESKELKGGESFYINNIKVSTQKVPHSIHAIAYRFEYNNQSIVVTGDLTYTKHLSSFAYKADYLIIDSGGISMKTQTRGKRPSNTNKLLRKKQGKSSKNRAHLNLSESSLIAKNAQVKNLVYTHFRRGVVDKQKSLNEIRKNYKENVIFAQDLIQLNYYKAP